MKLLLEECYKDEFDDLQDNEYIFGHEDGPVSYTHLDVYKRQAVSSGYIG